MSIEANMLGTPVILDNNSVKIIDPSFRELTFAHVRLEKISSGHLWTEGPVWFAEQQTLIFSDIPNNKLFRWNENVGTSILRENSNYANGNTRDLQGRLITCEHGSRRVTRTEIDGSITVIADSFEGKRLNSPNDAVVKSDGTIWFTDPSYGIMSDFEGNKADQEQDGRYVFKYDPATDHLVKVLDEFNQPNGLAFSKDESKLYVAESGYSHDDAVASVIKEYDVASNNELGQAREFTSIAPGVPDGFRIDIYGNIWTSAADGVHCYSSEGILLGKINVPEVVSNITFGGPRRNRLFITATTSVYATYVNTASAITNR